MTEQTLFLISFILIIEPLFALVIPYIQIRYLMLTSSDSNEVMIRLVKYNDWRSKWHFRTYGPFRRKARTCMWCIGFAIMAGLAANSIFDLHILK